MSENNRETSELEKIDLIEIVRDLLKNLKHAILIMVILFAMVFGYTYYKSMNSFYEVYEAKITISVSNANGDTSADTATASQLGSVFPYILSSTLLQDTISAQLGRPVSMGSVTVNNISGTPLLDVSVSAGSKEAAEEMLTAVLENYPEVARYVVGRTSYTIVNPMITKQTVTKISTLHYSLRRAISVSFMAGILISLFISLTYRTIKKSSDLRAVSNVHYLGTLPIYHKKRRKKSQSAGINILESNVQQSYLESMRQIRTRLLRRVHNQKNQVIMVTSSIAGEGKSTVSSNLAISLAQNGNSVLVIDCDVRNPSVQGVLNIKGEYPGIVSVIEGKTPLTNAIFQYGTEDTKIDILLGANKASGKIEVLGKPEMKAIVEQLKQEYDYIILDTAPAGLLADALLMSTYVDAAVYVVMCDYASRAEVVEGMKELQESGITIAGCVLNAGKSHSSESSNNYYYTKS